MLRYHKRVAIAGCAGSGKTLLAVEKAIRLDKAGLQTLMLCHSLYLANHLEKLCEGTQIQVFDFTSWANALAEVDSTNKSWVKYSEPTSEVINLAFDKLIQSNIKYDAVIVDEGQDFRDVWWTLIEASLSSAEHGILYIFHDDNQSLLPNRSKYPINQAPFLLSKNCRNSGRIFEIVGRFHSQSPSIIESLQNKGVAPVITYENDSSNHLSSIAESINRLLYDLRPTQLVVLTTEAEPVQNSVIENFDIVLKPEWQWQDTIQKHLGEINLSNAVYPTQSDIDIVSRQARSLLKQLKTRNKYYKTERINRNDFKWQVIEDAIEIKTRHPRNRIVGFLATEYWAEDIPRPKQVTILHRAEKANSIPLMSVSSYKGLESDAILLFVPYPFMGTSMQLKSSLYVGISRAKYVLHIVMDNRIYAQFPTYFD